MKTLGCILGLFALYFSAVLADCKGYSCVGVRVEAVQKGKADLLVETTGNESLLECSAFYGQLALKAREGYNNVESLRSWPMSAG